MAKKKKAVSGTDEMPVEESLVEGEDRDDVTDEVPVPETPVEKPTEPVAVATEEAPAKNRTVLHLVPLKAYLASAGIPSHRMAGFARWARDLKPATMTEWHERHQKFLTKPMR